MKISGFTIIRNAERFAYPFREAVLSVLPVCDEFIINVGKSDDNTLELAASVNDSRIRIVESEWDMELKGGKVLSTETNKAMSACSGDWLFTYRPMKFSMKNISMLCETLPKDISTAEVLKA